MPSDGDDRINVTNFLDALRVAGEANQQISGATFFRYANGEFPDAVLWLMLHPTVMDALRRDAEKMTPAQRERIKLALEAKRGSKSKRGKPGKSE